MQDTEVFTKLTTIMRDVFDDDTLEAKAGMTADDVAEWDSTNHVRLMVAIESAFGIRFETEEITKPQSVGELVAMIMAKQAAA